MSKYQPPSEPPPVNPVDWTILLDGQETTCVVKARLWYDARTMGAMLLNMPAYRVDAVQK